MNIASQSRGISRTVIRYVAVGACNTIFGFGCFAFFTMLLTPVISYGYVLASLLSNLFSITFAFLGYKWFVFKTHGDYIQGMDSLPWRLCEQYVAFWRPLFHSWFRLSAGTPGTRIVPPISLERLCLCSPWYSVSSVTVIFHSVPRNQPRNL